MAESDTPKNLIVCAARLVTLKGISWLLRALAPCRHLPWELWICGEGPQRAEFESLSRELALGDRVKFLGKVAPARLRTLVANCRFVVQPNIGPEGFGLAVAEASALGAPVVIFDVPALNEIIEHEKNGLIAARGNVEDLTRHLTRLLTDDALREKLGREGPRLMAERFSPLRHLEETLQSYRAVKEAHALAHR